MMVSLSSTKKIEKYVGGICKPGRVRNGCTLLDLKESVYKTTKINPNEFDIELAVNWPTDSGSKAIQLLDDEDVEVMFSAVTKSIELYVSKSSERKFTRLFGISRRQYGIGVFYTNVGK